MSREASSLLPGRARAREDRQLTGRGRARGSWAGPTGAGCRTQRLLCSVLELVCRLLEEARELDEAGRGDEALEQVSLASLPS